MKEFVKNFCKRGLVAFGFGPVIMAIVYISLELAGVEGALGFIELSKQILIVSAMAFVAAGISAIYKVERLALPLAIFIHAAVLYTDYILVYLINGWIKNSLMPLIIFTVIFIVGFALVWIIIYAVDKNAARKLNESLNKR